MTFHLTRVGNLDTTDRGNRFDRDALLTLGACPSNTKTAIFWGSKTPPGSPIVDPEALYEVVF
jgi:hypothetical protein